MVAQVYPHFLFSFANIVFLPSKSIEALCLNSRLDIGSPCLDPFWISKILLSSSVCTEAFWSVYLPQEGDVLVIDVARFECLTNRIVRDGVECLREVDRRCPHFDSPLMAFLFNQFVRCKVIRCLVGF